MTFCDIDPGHWIDVPAFYDFLEWQGAKPRTPTTFLIISNLIAREGIQIPTDHLKDPLLSSVCVWIKCTCILYVCVCACFCFCNKPWQHSAAKTDGCYSLLYSQKKTRFVQKKQHLNYCIKMEKEGHLVRKFDMPRLFIDAISIY